MKILSVGQMDGISNTCRLRNEALKKIADRVDVVNTSSSKIALDYKISNRLFNYGLPVHLPEKAKENEEIIELVKKNDYDMIWIDKGITITSRTLRFVKKKLPDAPLVSYSPDNMAERHNLSQNFMDCFPIYDYHITTKSYIIDDLKKLGARNVIFVNQSYEDSFHYPRDISAEDILRIGGDVGFIGMWERERMGSILYLSRNGIKVRVFGDRKWQQCAGDNPNLMIEAGGLFDEDYAKAFRCFKISLCFLRKMNHDQQTSRTMEIPACGGFMLAERTDEHMQLFEEGREAEFFSSDEELLKKCRYYLTHDEERTRIAESGTVRCLKSGYSNLETLKRIIKKIQE